MGKIIVRQVILRSVKTVQVHERPEDESERNRISLESIISYINRCGKAKGLEITQEEMALKLDISSEQLSAFLKGEEITPANLWLQLRAAYFDLLDAAEAEEAREGLKHTLVLVRNCGLAKGMNITVEEMIRKIEISEAQLHAYLKGEDRTPSDIPSKLHLAYKDLLENVDRIEVVEDLDTIIGFTDRSIPFP